MPTCSIEHTEAVRRYYAAFPALKKGRESPLQYYLPPPAWCRKSVDNKVKMQSELQLSKDWNAKTKKFTASKERRNSYHGQKKNKKRNNSYSRSFESKDSLPEWVTHEGAWDMETQDPVKEFIRAIALDEGYGTCENTVTEEPRAARAVPDWDDGLDLCSEWVITEDLLPRERTPMEEELYAKFEAKFDRSIEALWSRDQNTPDDELQDLPIDFQDLLASPSDRMFDECLWSSVGPVGGAGVRPVGGAGMGPVGGAGVGPVGGEVAMLPDRLRPLNIADEPSAMYDEGPPLYPVQNGKRQKGTYTEEPPVLPQSRVEAEEPCALYEGGEIRAALCSVASALRSLTALNHSRDASGFVEVPPRASRPPAPPAAPLRREPSREREDLLTSTRTHFRPIRREPDPEPRYKDGATFDIRGSLERAEFSLSPSGGAYLAGSRERYLEFRQRGIDYGRLNLTPAQRCPDLDDPALRLRFAVRQRDTATQTELEGGAAEAWPACEECGRAAKKMRCSGEPRAAGDQDDERDWEELLSDISAAHHQYEAEGEAEGGGERKRRHSARRCAAQCTHPHARFLPCCAPAIRPLTR